MGSRIATDYLVASPSFLTGVGSIFNVAGGYFVYNQHRSGFEADAAAIRRDWLKVAEDLRAAIEKSKAEAGCAKG